MSKMLDKLRSSTQAARAEVQQKSAASEGGSFAARAAAADDALAGRSGGLLTPQLSTHQAAPGDPGLLTVPIDLVHDNVYNARAWYDPAVVAQRAAELAADGQKIPALAVRHPERTGEYMLIDGHYRKRGLLRNGKNTIVILVRDDWTTQEQYFVQSWRANEERLGQSPLDNASQWALVLDQKVVASQERLASLLNVSESTLSKTLALTKLPAAAIAKAREDSASFSLAVLYQLTLLSEALPEAELLSLMERVAAEGWTRTALEQYRKDLAAPKEARKTKEISRQHKIMSGGDQIGTIKDWDSGRVVLDVKLDDAAKREELVHLLRERFGLAPDGSQLPLR